MNKLVYAFIFFLYFITACSSNKTKIDAPNPLPEAEEVEQLVDKLWSKKIQSSRHAFYKRSVYFTENSLTVAEPKKVLVIDLANGKIQREIALDEVITSAVSGYGNHIFIADQTPALYKIALDSGQTVWQQTLQSEILTPVGVNANIVVAKQSNGEVIAFSSTSGSVLWTNQTENPVLMYNQSSRPLVTENFSYIALDNGNLIAIDNQYGIIVWSQRINLPEGQNEIERLVDLDSDPILINNAVMTAGYNGNIAAIDIRSNQPTWYHQFSTIRELAQFRGMVGAVRENSEIVVYNANNGNIIWQSDIFLNRQLSNIVINDTYVIAADYQGQLLFLNRRNGNFIGNQKVGKKVKIGKGNTMPLYSFDNKIFYFSGSKKTLKLHALQIK